MIIIVFSSTSIFAILCGLLILSVAEGTCPVKLDYFKDSDCEIKSSSSSSPGPSSSLIIPLSNKCNFVLGALYKVTCNDYTLLLEPCFPSSFVQTQEYFLNACLVSPSPDVETKGPFRSFIGKCYGDTSSSSSSCPFTDAPTVSDAPSLSPKPKPKTSTADFVELPSPPLPPNKFADEPLDIELAHEAVHLAGMLIYKMDETNVPSILPDDYTFHLWKDTGSTEVLIVSTEHSGERDGKIMVIFRGTDDTPDGDWLTNINLPKVPFGPNDAILDGIVVAEDYFGFNKTYDLRVHRGFNNVFSDGLYDTVLEAILPLLQRQSENGGLYYRNTIHFFGHSLGGANAQVFGSYYAHFHPQIKTYVTTLGAPRQGNYAYKIFIESMPNLSVWRMVNCRDVVPRVPNFQYYHAGHLMWRKCRSPSKEPIANNIVEAYYRQSGDYNQRFAEVSKDFIINSYEHSMISDHFGYAYLEWLEYGLSNGSGRNWTSIFEPMQNTSMN